LGEAEEVVSEDLGEGGVSPEVLKSDPGTPWVEGAMHEGDTPCWCAGYATVGYCTAEGWVAGSRWWAERHGEEMKIRVIGFADAGVDLEDGEWRGLRFNEGMCK